MREAAEKIPEFAEQLHYWLKTGNTTQLPKTILLPTINWDVMNLKSN